MKPILLVAGFALMGAGSILAQPLSPAALSPAEPTQPADYLEGIPMTDYLALLRKISPAAYEGALAYVKAYEGRCGRYLQAVELRRAMAERGGDAVLMGMIRASHLHDTNGLSQWAQQVNCSRQGSTQ